MSPVQSGPGPWVIVTGTFRGTLWLSFTCRLEQSVQPHVHGGGGAHTRSCEMPPHDMHNVLYQWSPAWPVPLDLSGHCFENLQPQEPHCIVLPHSSQLGQRPGNMRVVEQPLSHCPCSQTLREGPVLSMARTGVLEEAVDTESGQGEIQAALPPPPFCPLPVSSGRSPGRVSVCP